MSAIALGSMVWYGGMDMLSEDGVTLGLMMAFILLINMLFRPVRHLADRINVLQRGIVASNRVFKVLDTNEFVNPDGDLMMHEVQGHLKFDRIHFSYIDEEPVLNDINFEVAAGQTLALVLSLIHI